jgi:geranylgeranyl diphosphate synthase, type II
MDAMARIEQALTAAVARAEGSGCPPRLAGAVRHAVFPRGSRLRPQLCLAVARASGEDRPELTDAAAASVELLHCASLIHDDLPCFDDAPVRRGKPSVHRAFGEPLAVLAGDALIVLAFETLARGAAHAPERLAALVLTVGHSVGMPAGIVAGQAWESEPGAVLADYQRAKTGALFAGATMAGAAAAGAEPGPWRLLGERLGEAYQVVDDIRDVAADPAELGKPTGRDGVLGRPNAARQLGMAGALERLDELVAGAVDSIPACPGAAELQGVIRLQAQRFLPKELSRRAA